MTMAALARSLAVPGFLCLCLALIPLLSWSAPSLAPTAVAAPAPSTSPDLAVGWPSRLQLSMYGGLGAAARQMGDPVIAAVGDIACDPSDPSFNGGAGTATTCRMRATGDLLGPHLMAVLALGDTQYESGALSAFRESYDPTWGRFKALTRPVVGNHEYRTANAGDYFTYFGSGAGDPAKGYYSYDIGTWHLIALNSNCAEVGGCRAGSPQEQWLRADLAAHRASCTLAYWHHPRFSSGQHGNDPGYTAFWQALYEAGADVVLNGHEHSYERFAPQDPNGTGDSVRGIRQFVVGTGGRSHSRFYSLLPNSEVRHTGTYGVLELMLRAGGYDWQFRPEAGKTFIDAGSGTCHTVAAGGAPMMHRPVPTSPPSYYATQVLETAGLVSYWRLGEHLGTSVGDSRSGNSGTYTGGVTLGLAGALLDDPDTAVSFDGESGYVRVPDAQDINLTGNVSIEAWVRPSSLDANSHTVVGKGSGDTPATRQYRLGMSPTAGNPRWRASVYIGNTTYSVDATTAPEARTWHHLVLIRDGGTLTVYVNGTADGTNATLPATGALNTTAGFLGVGALNAPSGPQYFAGRIDEVAIYNAALTPGQVQEHYSAAAR